MLGAWPACLAPTPGSYIDGDYVYEGDFFEDVITGSGKFKYASRAFYDGQWERDMYHGKGRYQWPDGRSYEVRVWGGRGEGRQGPLPVAGRGEGGEEADMPTEVCGGGGREGEAAGVC